MGKTDVEEYNPRDSPGYDSRQAGWRGGHLAHRSSAWNSCLRT